MEVDLLLTIGVATVALIVGFEVGAHFKMETPSLPDHITAAAKQLGELHIAHERAKTARGDVNVKLDSYITKLKQLFSWKDQP